MIPDDEKELAEALKLELLRRDHQFLVDAIADIVGQIRRLDEHRLDLERQLHDNESQWK